MWPRRLRRALSILLGLGATSFLAVSVRASLLRGEVLTLPRPSALVLALLATSVGVWLASTAWVSTLGEDGPGHRQDFLIAQLAKYIPGGVWQPLSQVGLSATRSISGRSSGSAVVAYAGAQIVSGALLIPTIVLGPGVPTWAKTAGIAAGVFAFIGLVLLGPIASLIASRGISEFGSLVAEKVRRALGGRVVWLLVINMGLQGLSFWVLGGSSLGLAAVGAYSAAWIVGFLAVPFPAGLGVREWILVLLLPVGSAHVIAVSVVQRLVGAVAGVSLILISRVAP